MSDDAADDNWFNANVFPCPHCGAQLFRVDRSPMYDEYHLYCDRCPNSVEVSYYDDVCLRLGKERLADVQDVEHREAAMRDLIEQQLRPCDCGGSYRFNVARRCFSCHQPVVEDEPWVDLFPSINGVELEGRDPTPAEQDLYEQFVAEYIRTRDIWKPGIG